MNHLDSSGEDDKEREAIISLLIYIMLPTTMLDQQVAAINRHITKAVLVELKETARIWSSLAMKDHLRERIAELERELEE